MIDDTPTVIDAEEVTEQSPADMLDTADATTAAPTVPPGTFDINAYNATLDVVRRRLSIIEQSKTEFKKLKEMYNDSFLNDELYVKADKIVKEATQKRKDIQAQLSKQPAVAELAQKVRELKEQIKSEEDSLADELMEYYKTAGVMEIEDADGNVREFQISIKLKPRIKME